MVRACQLIQGNSLSPYRATGLVAQDKPNRKPLLLAVDDDLGWLLLTREYLSSQGYDVLTAENGEEALSLLLQHTPDLVLLDILMPGLDGYEVCRRIRQTPDLKHIPVIVLTALEDPASEEQAYNIGAWDFVSKPVNWPALMHRVRYALRAAKAMAGERAANRFARVINQSPNEVLIFDATSLELLDANVSAVLNLGYSRLELVGRKFSTLLYNGSVGTLNRNLALVRGARQDHFHLQMLRKDGTSYPTEGTLLYADDHEPSVFVAILQDATEKRRIENEIHRLSFYDDLTGLPNRRMLQEQTNRLLSLAERKGTRCAICLLDIDDISQINNSLGPAAGDGILQELSLRLADVVRGFDIVARDELLTVQNSGLQLARFAGDEFILVLGDLKDPVDPARAAERALEAIALPCESVPERPRVTASIGIALYPDDGDTLELLVQRAHTALHAAKAAGKNRYSFYTESVNQSILGRLQLERELHEAVETQAFELHYQPIVDSDLQRVVGVECLLRWRHPQGMRFPDQFIPLAEKTGLIVPIGTWVLREAFAQLQAWGNAVGDDFCMAINISANQAQQADFVATVRELLETFAIRPHQLCFEITESLLIHDLDAATRWLRDIEAMGIRIALDDFGTGYSSLAYLVRLPVHCIKIDRGFTSQIDTDREQAAVATAIFQIAQALRLSVVAEGVETASQLKTLRDMGHCQIQGWLISKAMPASEFTRFLGSYSRIGERSGP